MHGMGQRVGEASPARLDAALRSMRSAHGANMARHAKTILHGALALAVMANVLGANPIRDVASIKSNKATKGATALTGDQLRELLAKLRTSDYCRDHDLVDPITVCPDRDRAAALNCLACAGATSIRTRTRSPSPAKSSGRPARD